MGKPSDKIMRVMRALDINDEEISKRLGQYTEDVEYFYQKYEVLRRRFPDQFGPCTENALSAMGRIFQD